MQLIDTNVVVMEHQHARSIVSLTQVICSTISSTYTVSNQSHVSKRQASRAMSSSHHYQTTSPPRSCTVITKSRPLGRPPVHQLATAIHRTDGISLHSFLPIAEAFVRRVCFTALPSRLVPAESKSDQPFRKDKLNLRPN
eukprot:scaffold3585_cov120-Alexandrium_tamarense.AAC.2